MKSWPEKTVDELLSTQNIPMILWAFNCVKGHQVGRIVTSMSLFNQVYKDIPALQLAELIYDSGEEFDPYDDYFVQLDNKIISFNTLGAVYWIADHIDSQDLKKMIDLLKQDNKEN